MRADVRREVFNAVPMCNSTLSIGFYPSFFTALSKLYSPGALAGISKDLPVFIISGDRDPVGGMGKLINWLYEVYKDKGLSLIEVKLYPEARYELLKELCREEVSGEVLTFYDGVLNTGEKKED